MKSTITVDDALITITVDDALMAYIWKKCYPSKDFAYIKTVSILSNTYCFKSIAKKRIKVVFR